MTPAVGKNSVAGELKTGHRQFTAHTHTPIYI